MAHLMQAQYVGTVPGLTDQNSGSRRSVSTMFPACPKEWHWVGQRARAGYGHPLPRTELVFRPHPDAPSDSRGPLLASPVSWSYVWGMAKGWAMWQAIPPDGYVTVGDTFHYSYRPDREETFNSYACVRRDCVRAVAAGQSIWDDHGTGARGDGSMWVVPDGTDNPWQRFCVQLGYHPPGRLVYTIDLSVIEIVAGP